MTDSSSDGTPPGSSSSERPPLPWAEVWKRFLPILDALVVLHSKGLVHGNLSLATFEFSETGGLDEGCIERLEAQAAVQSLPNVGPYTAPELALGTGADDPRVDVYSLGVILYELLCGRLPWSVDLDPAALQDRKANSKLPNPKRFQPDIPLDVLKVLRAATSGSPQIRPQSGVVMRALLGPAGHSVADEGELSSLTLDADPRLRDRGQVTPPQDEPDTDLSQLPTDLTQPAEPRGYDQKLGEAATTVMSAVERPVASASSPAIIATGSVSREDQPLPPQDMGDASTTVLAGAKRPETGADSTEAQGEDDKERPSRSDLAAGAVTTLHPAAFREGVESGPPAPGNPRAQIDDIRALLGTPLATESTEVLNYTESDHPAPISRPSGEPDFAFEEGEGSPKPRHRRKGARKKKKKAGLAGGLLLWLTLGLGILVFCGLTLGLMFFRSLAQGPNSGQVEELLGLTDEAERPSGAAGTGETDTDPYSERWRALEGTDEPPVTDAAEDGDGAASDEESPSGDQARDSNASDPASTNEPERGGRKSAAVTGSSSKKTSRPKTSGKGRSSTTRKSPRGSNGKKSDSPEPPAAPETVLNINQAPRVVRAKIGRRTLFRVEIPSSPGGPDLSVQLRMRCVSDGGRWRLYKMTPSGRSTWSERINFDIGDRGRCEYYFTARADGDASSSSLGSKSEPLQVQVR